MRNINNRQKKFVKPKRDVKKERVKQFKDKIKNKSIKK
jgi:hypothetical protein